MSFRAASMRPLLHPIVLRPKGPLSACPMSLMYVYRMRTTLDRSIIPGRASKYRIAYFCCGEEVIFNCSVVSLEGENFEAHAFDQHELPTKIYLTRKRKLPRLEKFNNKTAGFQLNEKRILMCGVSGNGVERHCRSHQERQKGVKAHRNSKEQSP
jgi:hypothetical protein